MGCIKVAAVLTALVFCLTLAQAASIKKSKILSFHLMQTRTGRFKKMQTSIEAGSVIKWILIPPGMQNQERIWIFLFMIV